MKKYNKKIGKGDKAMASYAKALKMNHIYMSVTVAFLLLCFVGGIQAGEMGSDREGLTVTVLLYSGRPNPEYVLEGKDVLDQLKAFLNKARVNEKFKRTSVLPSILGYNGIVVDNRGKMSDFPSRFAVYRGNIEVSDKQKRFLVDEGGVVESFLLDQAMKKGVIDERAAQFIRSDRTTACLPPIRLAFVVNQDHYAISAADLDQTAAFAHYALQAATGRGYVYNGAVFGHYGALDPTAILEQYVLAHSANPADYVVIFTKDTEALQYGGFTLPAFGRSVDGLSTQLASLPGYCNPAGSPYEPPGVVYGAVLDWHHILGGCGYELQGLDWVHVSATSFGGQCRNTPGLTCVLQYSEWQCPNLLSDPEWAPLIADRRRDTAQSVNHELLHNFGFHGINDHQCPPGTPADVVAQSAFNMCGSTIVTLKAAGQRCVLDPRPMGTVCTHKSQCLNSYCYEFGLPIEYQCSHTCATKADCADVPGKDPFCRKRRLDIPSTDLSCYYQ